MSVVAERESVQLSPRPVHPGPRRSPRAGYAPGCGVPGARYGSGGQADDRRARVLRGGGRATAVGCSARPRPLRLPAIVGLVLAGAALVAGLGLLSGVLSEQVSETAPVPERTAVVVLEQGQTIWELAGHYAPDSAAAAVVHRIQRLNELEGSSVTAGTPLVVPIEQGSASGIG